MTLIKERDRYNFKFILFLSCALVAFTQVQADDEKITHVGGHYNFDLNIRFEVYKTRFLLSYIERRGSISIRKKYYKFKYEDIENSKILKEMLEVRTINEGNGVWVSVPVIKKGWRPSKNDSLALNNLLKKIEKYISSKKIVESKDIIDEESIKKFQKQMDDFQKDLKKRGWK